MAPASHQQYFWGRNKKKKVFTGEKTRSDFRKGLKLKQKHSDSAISSTKHFLPQQAEICANEVKGSGQVFVEFKSEVGKEAPAFVVGFSQVIIASLVGWEMHFLRGMISWLFWQVLLNLQGLYQSSLENSDYWGLYWTSEGTSGPKCALIFMAWHSLLITDMVEKKDFVSV